LKHRSGSIENPLSLFILSFISLVIGGTITWYVFIRDSDNGSRNQDPTRAEIIASEVEETVPARTASVENRERGTFDLSPTLIDESRRNAIVVAAERVGQAVVSINVHQTQVVMTRNSFFNDFWSDFFFPRTYKREVQNLGSGFIISDEGYILTNEHMVRGAEEITVILEDSREFQAVVQGTDKQTDLAVLKIDAQALPVAPLGTSLDLMIGEWVIAIGNPFGYLLDDTQPTVTVGVISAVKRDIKVSMGEESIYADMIQTDASINPGNSGGPLVNSRGEVIGVNTFIFTKGGGSLGMGFAIPIDRAKRVYNEILQHKKVLKPWVGIHPQDLTPSLRKGFNLEEDGWGGVIVADVDSGSPAHQVGIKTGDVITQINSDPIRSAHDWHGILLDVCVGDELSLDVYNKEGNRSVITMSTIPLPTDTAEKITVEFGIVLTDVTGTIKSQLGLRSGQGALIVDVEDPNLLHESGLEPYDVILKVNEIDINSASKAKNALENLSKRRNSIVLERNGRLIYRSLLIG
jgi:serine protease Do